MKYNSLIPELSVTDIDKIKQFYIDTASTLGMCAERNAIANMITNGESQIDKVAAIVEDGSVGAPCGACREYMMQLDKDSGDIEILIDYETRKTVKLIELIPGWWGNKYV